MSISQEGFVYSVPFGSVSTSSFIGVGIACGGNILISLALTLQKLAHRRNEEHFQAEQLVDHEEGVGRWPSDASPILEEDEPVPFRLRNTEDEGFGHTKTNPAHANEDERMVESVSARIVPERKVSDTVASGPSCKRMDKRHAIPYLKPIYPAKHTTVRAQFGTPPPSITRSQVQEGQETASALGLGDGAGAVEMEESMYLKSRLWWLGMVLIALGEGGNFLSYAFAPASVVAPLGTVALIANCVFAPLILGETFHRRELIGMALAIVGAVTVVWSFSTTNPRLDPDQLLSALSRTPFLIYTLLNILVLLPLLYLSSASFGNAHLLVDLGICTIFGGYTVLATKALSSLLSQNLLGAWREGVTWGCAAVVAGTSLGQVKWLNRALMRFQSKEVIPTQFVLFTFSAIIGSAVLYQEFRDIPLSCFINFTFGIATTFLGVHFLASNPSAEDMKEEEENKNNLHRPERVRATSSTSVDPFLPSAPSERTSLLNYSPKHLTSTLSPRYSGGSSLIRLPSTALLGTVPTTPSTSRISRKGSISELRTESMPTLTLSSQGGILLLATTPPKPASIGSGARGRD
nr:hypothetical protein L204_00580 [Cryptococcus depauperatus CBS 7855]